MVGADLPARIGLGQGQRHIAGDGREAENLQLRRGKRQQDGDGVVQTGIGVDDDAACGHVDSCIVVARL